MQFLAIIPLALYQLLYYMFPKKRKSTFAREAALFCFSIILVLILSVTGITKHSVLRWPPDIAHINLSIGSSITDMLQQTRGVAILNIVGNILLFVPFGFLLPLLWPRNGLFRTVLYGTLFSALIETTQLFLSRSTDIDDILLNTFGAMLGFVCSRLFLFLAPHRSEEMGHRAGGALQPLLMAVVAMGSMFVLG